MFSTISQKNVSSFNPRYKKPCFSITSYSSKTSLFDYRKRNRINGKANIKNIKGNPYLSILLM